LKPYKILNKKKDLQSYLKRAIISKLTDQALIIIGTITELTSLPLDSQKRELINFKKQFLFTNAGKIGTVHAHLWNQILY
jgi:hypothetical protein